jgi:uncharacterized protein (TIGR02453 family)
MAGANPYVSPRTFRFFREIAAHNEREWFNANKERYIEQIRDPLLELVKAFEPRLEKISSQFVVDARANGGSLFRIYRDTRFARDKSPYKTYAGMSFRHHAAHEMPAPSFYLHLEPGRVFAAAGLWHPRSEPLRDVREAIVESPARWKKVSRSLDDGSENLKRVPRGFDPEHQLAEDLKRKSFTLSTRFTQQQACAPDFLARYAQACRKAAPLMEFLCDALGVEW